jgi:hypothetical protein
LISVDTELQRLTKALALGLRPRFPAFWKTEIFWTFLADPLCEEVFGILRWPKSEKSPAREVRPL